jgi:hypothetical protein
MVVSAALVSPAVMVRLDLVLAPPVSPVRPAVMAALVAPVVSVAQQVPQAV